ncbi:hypothetical protein B0H19DRAFT_1369173 [Mycena capillaripes]|nr:hypothetical protein B0H19DRAFT_1369173 [Mycena capillaripes]
MLCRRYLPWVAALYCGRGTFTSIIKNYTTAPTIPSDFRMIPLGDIDLQDEIRVDNRSGVVNRHSKRARVRVYSAKLDGRTSNMTVAMYQGKGAEEDWREDIARYMAIRHPNILQIFAAASSRNIYATVYHGDLIPLRQFLDLYRHSPILTVYIYAHSHTELIATQDYFHSAFRHFLPNGQCTLWIRRSTGRLCVDLIPDNDHLLRNFGMSMSSPQAIIALDASNQEETMAIDCLTLEEYHIICWAQLPQLRELDCGVPFPPVTLGAIIFCSAENRFEDSLEIALLPDAEFSIRKPWESRATGEMMEDGWIRYNSDGVLDTTFLFDIFIDGAPWMSQANHIFNRLQIMSNFENYFFAHYIRFSLVIRATTPNTPKGFLFLCPETHFRAGPSSFTWPDCPAYWSLHSSGAERLSMNEAICLGFPSVELTTVIKGGSWDASVYAGLLDDSTATAEPPSLPDELDSSQTFRLVMNVQMALMIFLALSWLYNSIMHEK